MDNIETILFDFDGTLVDTNELIYQSFVHTFHQFGYDFTREEILQFNGPPLIETFETLDKDRAREMIQTYQTHNLAAHEQYMRLFPNVEETLEKLQAANIKLGIVSTKMRNAVDLGLEVTGISHYFDSVITLNDVEHAKPHPEPVLKGMDELNGDIETSLMVGDNYHDIVSGKQAGVRTAGVAWSLKGRDFLQSYEPTFMLEDMRDLLTIIEV